MQPAWPPPPPFARTKAEHGDIHPHGGPWCGGAGSYTWLAFTRALRQVATAARRHSGRLAAAQGTSMLRVQHTEYGMPPSSPSHAMRPARSLFPVTSIKRACLSRLPAFQVSGYLVTEYLGMQQANLIPSLAPRPPSGNSSSIDPDPAFHCTRTRTQQTTAIVHSSRSCCCFLLLLWPLPCQFPTASQG